MPSSPDTRRGAKPRRFVVKRSHPSKEFSWMRASLDGMSRNFAVAVEIKCGTSTYRKAAQYGVIPDYYHGQLQHILAVCGLPSIDYWCWQPGCRGILIPVRRNDTYIARLIKAESTFWKRVQKARRRCA